MPEGPECAVVANAIQKGLPCVFEGTEIIENVPGKLHRYSRKKPENWHVISHNRFNMKRARTKGKLILIDIETLHDQKEWVLAITLGMEADFRWNSAGHKHTRFTFIKQRGDLSFCDSRCFGTLRILNPDEARELEKTKGWDLLKAKMPRELWQELQHHKRIKDKPIGPVLLDQTLFSGIGNIYKSESLYKAKIHPASIVNKIPKDKWELINLYSHAIMQEAYKKNGTSVIDFTADGVEGQGQELLRIYMKSTCPRDHKVSKLKQGKGSNERTSWYCKQCQPLYT